MDPFVTSRRSAIAPFYVMEVMRASAKREAAGHEVLHLEVGQPSTPAPATVLARAHDALDNDRLGYTEALGLPALRSAISQWYQTSNEISVPLDQIVVTTGASGSSVLSFLALWDPGERVGVLEPGYPCYRNDLETFGIEVVPIPVGPDTSYRPTRAILDQAGPMSGLVLASPSNPTGTVLSEEDLAMVADWAATNGVALVVDEIYHGITYDKPASSILKVLHNSNGAVTPGRRPPVLVFNSFSKYFSMTGWRLGWIVAPKELMTPLERLAQNLTIAPPTLSQLGGVAAFDGVEECEANVHQYRENRAIVLDGLGAAGMTELAPPDGAFYVWCDISHLLSSSLPTSQELCAHWFNELGIAVTPGVDFDRQRGDRFVRFSYAGSPSTMTEAMARLQDWTRRHGSGQI